MTRHQPLALSCAAPVRRTHVAVIAALFTLGVGLVAPPLALSCVAIAVAASLFANQSAVFSLRLRLIAGPALAAGLVGVLWGLDGAMGVLLVWRIFADARWAASNARLMAIASGAAPDRGPAALAVWAIPAVGLATAAYSAPHLLLGLPLDLPHVPFWIPLALGGLAVLALFDWGVQKLADWRLGALARASTALLLAHHAIFLAAYVASPDLSAGVMAMIVWRLAHAAATAQR